MDADDDWDRLYREEERIEQARARNIDANDVLIEDGPEAIRDALRQAKPFNFNREQGDPGWTAPPGGDWPSGRSVHLRPGFNPITGDTIEPEKPLEPLQTLDLASLAAIRPARKEHAIERIAPKGEVTYGTGAGAAGKSLTFQQCMTASAAGLSFLRLAVEQGPAIFLTCEDSAEELHWRQAHICAALGVDMASLAGKLHLVSLRGELGNELCTFTQDGRLVPTRTFRRIEALIEATGAKLVTLDNVAHLYPDSENDRAKVTMFVNLLNRLAGRTGAAIILIGHFNKAGDEYSGSTAWLNSVRSHFVIEHDLETDVRTLKLGKANYSRRGDAIRFIWRDWAFVHEDDLPSDEAAELRESAQAASDNKIFLTCLDERDRQRRAVSEKPSRTYAPAVFDKMPESKGIGKDRLERAMDRLFRIQAIERGFKWVDKGERKPVHGIRRSAGNGAGNPRDNGAGNVRRTVSETAENRAGNGAANAELSNPILTVYTGGAPDGPPAPVDDAGDGFLPSWGSKADAGL